jgi:hypothetical protein
MFSSLGLAFLFGRGAPSSVMEDVKPLQLPAAQETQQTAPAETEQK